MSADDVRDTLRRLWSPLLAITSTDGGRINGQIAVTGLPASIVPDAPRVLVELWKANLTHDMVRASGVFAVHLLPAAPKEALGTSLSLVRTLGMRSGRDEDKMAGLSLRQGMTGSPILTDALSYVEARVVATLDGDEMTIFLGDVLAGECLREGNALTMHAAREQMPRDWLDEWERNHRRQLAEAKRRRGHND
jgi:flavin reductase (DIM6/NTAB) family NADH-FMN oxidoreductase RutF